MAKQKDTSNGEATARRQRGLQDDIDAKDARQAKGDAEKKQPVQAGLREQPTELPAQHLEKPGDEHALELEPRFLAPDYIGSSKLDGMAAIITGGDSGIGRAVASCCARRRGLSPSSTCPSTRTRRRPSASSRRKGVAAC
jgi:hypothetical protein